MKKLFFILFQLLFTLALNAQGITKYTSTNLNMRTSPDASSKVVTVIPKGTSVALEEDCDCDWVPVSYAGKTGYVSGKYLTKEKVKPDAPKATGPVKYYTNSQGNKVQSPTRYPSTPAGATALCRDGTYSFSQSRRGTCSHHGGVARWL